MKRKLRLGVVLLLASILLAGCIHPYPQKGPLEFTELTLGKNSIGVPVISVTVVNTSINTVKAFTVKAKAWNAYGSRLKSFGFGDDVYGGISQTSIEPGQERTVRWTMNGYDTAHKIEVRLATTITTDDKKWVSKNADPFYIQTKTY